MKPTRRMFVATAIAIVANLAPATSSAAEPAASSGAPRQDAKRPAGFESLDYAFRFASAIRSDPKDMGQAQASVVMDYATAGSLSEAMRLADRVEGWRRGIAYADLATLLSRDGRRSEAESMLAKARDFSMNQTGWQGRRVESHVAAALSALGRLEESREIAGRLAQDDPQQYTGKGVATVASGHADRGEYAQALNQLDQLEKDPDIDSAWWRTAGYVAVAGKSDLPRDQRTAAIRQARDAATMISGWRRGEALRSIAHAAARLEMRKEAKQMLEDAEIVFDSLPPTVPVKAALLANLARSWNAIGELERVGRLLDSAIRVAPEAAQIDRPAIYANIAHGYQATGRAGQARVTWDRALAEAESLTNARPRALAVVEVCRALGRAQLDPDDKMRLQLDRIFGNLSDPW